MPTAKVIHDDLFSSRSDKAYFPTHFGGTQTVGVPMNVGSQYPHFSMVLCGEKTPRFAPFCGKMYGEDEEVYGQFLSFGVKILALWTPCTFEILLTSLKHQAVRSWSARGLRGANARLHHSLVSEHHSWHLLLLKITVQ